MTEVENGGVYVRVMVVGATGMLGHKLCQVFEDRYEVWAVARRSFRELASYRVYDAGRFLGGVDVTNPDNMVRAFRTVKPDVVLNCVGIIKQLPAAKDPIISLTINSLLPHRLAELCGAAGARLIHVSTDCVFSGTKGMYTEDDQSDATDLYGRSKFLGEVTYDHCLTLRTSIIGREMESANGLVEWFLANRGGRVKGFTGALYTGFTTPELAEIIGTVIDRHHDLSGLYQVSSEPISKFDLLHLVSEAFQVDIEIQPSDSVQLDRTLDSSRFRMATGFVPKSWPAMVQEMAADRTPYDQWRQG